MMAQEASGKAVLDQPGGAARALEAMAAGAAQSQGRVTAAIEEQKRLLAGLEGRGELAHQRRRQEMPALDALAAQIDEPHDGKLGRRVAARQRDALVAAARDIDHCFERRGGRDQDDRDVGQRGAQHRHIAGLVDDPVLLLVGGIVLLVDDDQPEFGEGQEQRRTGADDHARPAGGDGPPGVPALGCRHVGMPLLRAAPRNAARNRSSHCAPRAISGSSTSTCRPAASAAASAAK